MTSASHEKPPLPWYFLFLATSYVLLGVWGVYQTISSGFRQPEYTLSFLLLLGASLFFRSRVGRFVALVWLIPNYVFVATVLFAMLFVPSAVSFHFAVTLSGIGLNADHISYAPHIYIGLYLLLTIAQQVILTRGRVRQSIPPLSFVARLTDRLEGFPPSRKNRIAWLSSLAVVAAVSAFVTFRTVEQLVSIVAADSQISNARPTAAVLHLLSQDEKEKAQSLLCTVLAHDVQSIDALRAETNKGFFPTWALADALAQGAEKRELGQKKVQSAIELCKNKFGTQ